MEQVDLQKQERRTVTLKSLATAGYRWSATTDNPKVVEVEIVTRRETAEPVQPGHSLDEQFDLIGIGVGETTVHFSQARHFEPGKPPLAVYDLKVRVVAEGAT